MPRTPTGSSRSRLPWSLLLGLGLLSGCAGMEDRRQLLRLGERGSDMTANANGAANSDQMPESQISVVVSAFGRVRSSRGLTVLQSLDPRAQTVLLNRVADALERKPKNEGEQKSVDAGTGYQELLDATATSLFASALAKGTTSFLEVPVTLTVQLAAPTLQPPGRLSQVRLTLATDGPGCIRAWSQPRWTPATPTEARGSTIRAVAYRADPTENEPCGKTESRLEISATADGAFNLEGTFDIDLDLELKQNANRASLTVGRPGGEREKDKGVWLLPDRHPVTIAVKVAGAVVRTVTLGGSTRRENDDVVRFESAKKDLVGAKAEIHFVPPYWSSSCSDPSALAFVEPSTDASTKRCLYQEPPPKEPLP